jgi:putative tricarboxylic transport membrane protein
MSSFTSARLFSRPVILAAALAMGLGASAPVMAADALTLMAPAAPGGGWDSTARAMQEVLQQAGLAKSVQVENVAGAGGTIGIAQFVSKKKGDGNALMVTGLVMVGATIANKSPVTLPETTPIARLTSEWQAIAVTPQAKIQSMADLAAALKANTGAVSWGGGSAGGTDHITVGLVAKAAGGDASKINYVAHSGGGEAMAAVLGNHVSVGINSLSEFIPQVKAGKLKIIGVSSDKRIPGVDAPTFKEAGVDVVIGNWRGVVAAPGITPAQKADLAAQIDKMVKSPQWQAKLKEKGWEDNYMGADAFTAYVKSEQDRIGQVLKSVGIGG